MDRELLAAIAAVLGLATAALELGLTALRLWRERQRRREHGYRDARR